MAEKKIVKKIAKTKTTESSSKIKPKAKKQVDQSDDISIVIVDDDISIDQEKVNEERRAYLEESRSQDAYD